MEDQGQRSQNQNNSAEFRKFLAFAGNMIEKGLARQPDAGNSPVKTARLFNNIVMAAFSVHASEYKKWLTDIGLQPLFVEKQKQVLSLVKSGYFYEIDPQHMTVALIKNGVTVGASNFVNCETLLSKLGVEKTTPGYYLALAYLLQSPRFEIVQVAHAMSENNARLVVKA